MIVLKWIWKIILNLAIIPTIVAIIAMVACMFFIDDSNQKSVTNETVELNRLQPTAKYKHIAEYQEMQNDDFDVAGIVTMVAFAGTFVIMVIITVSDFKEQKKAKQKVTEDIFNGKI